MVASVQNSLTSWQPGLLSCCPYPTSSPTLRLTRGVRAAPLATAWRGCSWPLLPLAPPPAPPWCPTCGARWPAHPAWRTFGELEGWRDQEAAQSARVAAERPSVPSGLLAREVRSQVRSCMRLVNQIACMWICGAAAGTTTSLLAACRSDEICWTCQSLGANFLAAKTQPPTAHPSHLDARGPERVGVLGCIGQPLELATGHTVLLLSCSKAAGSGVEGRGCWLCRSMRKNLQVIQSKQR